MRPAGWKVFGHAMFKLSQLNVTEVAEFVQRNFQNLFIMAASPGKQIPPGHVTLGLSTTFSLAPCLPVVEGGLNADNSQKKL